MEVLVVNELRLEVSLSLLTKVLSDSVVTNGVTSVESTSLTSFPSSGSDEEPVFE
jgi:hypothetical protein